MHKTIIGNALVMSSLLALCVGTMPPAGASEAPESDLVTGIDEIFSDIDPAQDPGCAVGVIHQGEYLVEKGYGLANLEYDIPISAQSVFRTGSVSKQFTAMAIALLAQRGDIDLDADIHDYLPELVDYGHKVTIRQMLTHTAGMRDYEEDIFQIEGKPFRFGNEDYWTVEEFYTVVQGVPLRHPPGEQWEYSNLGYFLLSQVVEQVTGQTLRQFAQAEIFAPLGMSHSLFNDNVDGVIKNRADGYKRNDTGGYDIYMTNLDIVGDGGVYTSLEDFIAWDRNFYDNRLGDGSADLLSLMNTPGADVEDEGRPAGAYAFGQFVSEENGETVYSHSGSWVGFRAYYERRPAQGLSVVLFCNLDELNPGERGAQIMTLAGSILSRN